MDWLLDGVRGGAFVLHVLAVSVLLGESSPVHGCQITPGLKGALTGLRKEHTRVHTHDIWQNAKFKLDALTQMFVTIASTLQFPLRKLENQVC